MSCQAQLHGKNRVMQRVLQCVAPSDIGRIPEKRLDNIRHQIATFPATPGVYLMKDVNGDGDIDLHDLARAQSCFSGEYPAPCPTGCSTLDLDRDDDIDLDDFAAFADLLGNQ